MAFINSIVEYEGPVVDVRPRYWAAHCEALAATGLTGPTEEEFWRLWRTGSPPGMFARHGKPHMVDEYLRKRNERIDSSELMAHDEPQPKAAEDLRVLKQLGNCHLATLCANREGINATLDRTGLWLFFDQKRSLPESRERRVAAIRELIGGQQRTLAVAGTVAFAYAAGEAGCRVVGMKNGPAVPQSLRRVGVDVFFDSLDALTDALTRHDPELQRIGLF
jgi:phosphoglycolate phosphatase-like HAD superfamily hydrolase